jgi:hypothetical protein
MKYLGAFAAVGASLWLVGCASAPRVVVDEPLGPGPAGGAPATGQGSLVIYSARTPANIDLNQVEWRWNNDFGRNAFLHESAHSDYTIYTQSGEVLKRVHNARDANDETPTVVTLPAGSYKVEADGINCDANRVKVVMVFVIKPGQTTMAHLEGGWNPGGQYQETEVAKLPCGRVIGLRAAETGYAGDLAGARFQQQRLGAMP